MNEYEVFQDISFEKNQTIFSKPMLPLIKPPSPPLEKVKGNKFSWHPEDEPSWFIIYGVINNTEKKKNLMWCLSYLIWCAKLSESTPINAPSVWQSSFFAEGTEKVTLYVHKSDLSPVSYRTVKYVIQFFSWLIMVRYKSN